MSFTAQGTSSTPERIDIVTGVRESFPLAARQFEPSGLVTIFFNGFFGAGSAGTRELKITDWRVSMRSLGVEGIGAHIEITGGVIFGDKYHSGRFLCQEPKKRRFVIHSKHGKWTCKSLSLAHQAREILDADISVQEKEGELIKLGVMPARKQS